MAKYSGIFTPTQQMQATAASNWTAVPGSPTSVTATAGAGQATVSFTAPTFTGNPAGISSYIVTSSPGGFTASGSASPITVTGLTNGTAYTFTVQAVGTFTGPGAISSPSNSVTPSPSYIEDVFSTWLYSGTTSPLTINNGINLLDKGGMVWFKTRNSVVDNAIVDTERSAGYTLRTNTTVAQQNNSADWNGFTSTGFSVSDSQPLWNQSGNNYVSWTFREQPKFFDVVTWTGNGASSRQISHNLGSVPGCVMVKCTSTSTNWLVAHRSLGTSNLQLNTTATATKFSGGEIGALNSSTTFTVAENVGTDTVNANGQTYVAYLFAHDAGGFGAAGTDNVISCGSFTTDGSGNATVNLGYEPQFVMFKLTNQTSNWEIRDTMRGFTVGDSAGLLANTSGAEFSTSIPTITSTGFNISWGAGFQGIYIAIRRGPMKTPTTGTSVFSPEIWSGDNSSNRSLSAGIVDDMFFYNPRSGASNYFGGVFFDRLRGNNNYLVGRTTAVEINADPFLSFTSQQNGVVAGAPALGQINASGVNLVGYHFQRAPGFFDEVCYTGDGSARTITHNLGVAPELIITKFRTGTGGGRPGWWVGGSALGSNNVLVFNTSDPLNTYSGSSISGLLNFFYGSGTYTSTGYSLGAGSETNNSGDTYVSYLFASCAGVSKVGSYTGTGGTQTINCGFTSGARFVLIKSTSATGNWYYWDSARGIVAGNDPYSLMNVNSAEVTNTDWVDTAASGFELSNAVGNLANSNGVSYIFLAIA